jgi:N-dimethylarginine dimethylaminohydrolase
MHRTEQPIPDLAQIQWHELRRVLIEDIGCLVYDIPQDPTCPDMVFTANAGLVVDDTILLSRFRHPQRKTEEPLFYRWFAKRRYRVAVAPNDLRFEGEGDALIAGDTVLAGYLKRSDIKSHNWISQELRRPVLSLALTEDKWYHLDTCLFVLNKDLIAFYPGAFDEYGQRVLRSKFETIEINKKDAMRFAANSVCIGRHIVMPAGSIGLRALLEARGFQVHNVEMSEFMKAGGAAKCLVLFLNHESDYCLPITSP